MTDMPQPHDHYFKNAMSNKRVAQSFFKKYLPKKILALMDLEKIKLSQSSYVDEELKSSYIDLLFSVNFDCQQGYLYVLVEHQSRPDRWMALRIKHYVMQILINHIKDRKNKVLPIVYPVVFYNGDIAYPYSQDFFELFGKDAKLAKQLTLRPFQLIDLNTIDDSILRERNWSNLMSYLMKYIRARDIIERIDDIATLLVSVMQEGGRTYVEATVQYLVVNRPKQEKNKIINALNQKLSKLGGDNPMISIADSWVKEGVEQGMQQGMQQGMRMAAMRMFAKNMPLDAISEITGLSIKTLKLLQEEVVAVNRP